MAPQVMVQEFAHAMAHGISQIVVFLGVVAVVAVFLFAVTWRRL